jgi:lipopolysaccharide biosynthesis glycosyltransferase
MRTCQRTTRKRQRGGVGSSAGKSGAAGSTPAGGGGASGSSGGVSNHSEALYLYTPTNQAYEGALDTKEGRDVYGDRVVAMERRPGVAAVEADTPPLIFAEHLHVLVIATTLNQQHYELLRAMLQSLLLMRGAASAGHHYTVWVCTDETSWELVEQFVQRFDGLPCVSFRLFRVDAVLKLAAEFQRSAHVKNKHYSGAILMVKLLIAEMEELRAVRRVLMLDYDMLFLDDIGSLFTSAQLSLDRYPGAFFAMTAPRRPSYITPKRLEHPADLYWVSGCALLDLERMRTRNFTSLLRSTLVGSFNDGFTAGTGDQAVFNAFLAQHPHGAVPIHCSWNLWAKFDLVWDDEVKRERSAYTNKRPLDRAGQVDWVLSCPHHPKPRLVHYSGPKKNAQIFHSSWTAALNVPSRFLHFCP